MTRRRNHVPVRLADLIGVGVTVAITAAVAFGLVAPSTLRARAVAADASAAARVRQRANGLAVSVRSTERELERVRVRLASTPLKVHPVAALNERLAALIALAGECGLGVSDLKPGEPTRDGKFLSTPVRLAGGGRYPDVVRLLHRLPQRMPDLAVAGFRLTAGADDATGGEYVIEARWQATPDAGPATPPRPTPAAAELAGATP